MLRSSSWSKGGEREGGREGGQRREERENIIQPKQLHINKKGIPDAQQDVTSTCPQLHQTVYRYQSCMPQDTSGTHCILSFLYWDLKDCHIAGGQRT